MRICIYEDRLVAGLEPLTLTRPASDLLCGLDSLGAKQSCYFAAEVTGFLGRPELAVVLRERSQCPVNDPVWLRAAPTVLVNARWLPPTPTGIRVAPATRRLFASGPSAGMSQGELAFAVLDARQLQTLAPNTIDDCLADLIQALPQRDVGGQMIRRPWDLIQQNGTQIAADFGSRQPTEAGRHPAGFALRGPADRLYIHPAAKIDPFVVADTTNGPVWIGANAVIHAFTRLEGPCAIGANTQVLGAKIRAGTTIGPHCRIGGEVECSIVQGFTNKYHDGFLGHSYVGEWVNLAAGTITGDLRFDYQPITIRSNGESVPTSEIKLGSIIGDHVRTGLGVLLNCGTTIRPFATILPTGRLAPRDIASFTQVTPEGIRLANVESALNSAAIAMSRRDERLTAARDALYRSLAGQDAGSRPQVKTIFELRKSA